MELTTFTFSLPPKEDKTVKIVTGLACGPEINVRLFDVTLANDLTQSESEQLADIGLLISGASYDELRSALGMERLMSSAEPGTINAVSIMGIVKAADVNHVRNATMGDDGPYIKALRRVLKNHIGDVIFKMYGGLEFNEETGEIIEEEGINFSGFGHDDHPEIEDKANAYLHDILNCFGTESVGIAMSFDLVHCAFKPIKFDPINVRP